MKACCRFLKEIGAFFEQTVWLDKTWVNIDHTLRKGWMDNILEGTMRVPLGQGRRYTIVDTRTTAGFYRLFFNIKKMVNP